MEAIFTKGCMSLFESGPAWVLLVLILYGFYRLLLGLGTKVGVKIMASLDKPAEALTKQADALTVQSASMDRLTSSIQDYVGRDGSEHQEIIILQKVIRQELKGIREQSDRIEGRLGEKGDG